MAFILKEGDAKDWVYKGEGAANLVLSYRGSSSSLVPKGKIRSADGCLVLSKEEKQPWKDFEELLESTSKGIAGQVYVKHVISPLLDPKHIDVGIRITVYREFLESVKASVHNQRPAWRIDASEVDIHCDSAHLISDHSVFLSNKASSQPKCGFLPSSEFIAKQNIIKKCVTRFKMHQLLKLHEGEISQISAYDPLDLFSGSKDRICQAITALLTTPGNNFWVFLNGSLIFGGLGGGIDTSAVLSHEANEKIDAFFTVSGIQLASFIELVAEALMKSAVLDKLLAAQKLDVLDIEGAIHLYYNIMSESCIVCKDTSNTELLLKYSFLHSFSLEASLKIVREYLIAVTAKDCSLMICFRPAGVEGHATEYDSIFLKSCNRSFDYKAYFIDLDRKPLRKMVQYYELDQKIVDNYAKKVMIEERACTSTMGRD